MILFLSMPQHLLLDGYNLVFRAYYAMPQTLSRSDGLPTGAIHGFFSSVWHILDMEKPDEAVMFFDLGGASRQKALLDDYKANRAAMPDALRKQVPYIKNLARLMGLGAVEKEGIEADDLIATFAKRFSDMGDSVRIVSADKDLGQCVALKGVTQLTPPATSGGANEWRVMDAAGVEEKFGVKPERIPDLLALTGDSADNIPGIDGVGIKTAASWIKRFGDLEGVINNCGDLKPVRFQKIVYDSRVFLRRNIEMTKLDFNVEGVESKCPPRDIAGLRGLLMELEMKRALETVGSGL
jgi:DNA polymerase I